MSFALLFTVIIFLSGFNQTTRFGNCTFVSKNLAIVVLCSSLYRNASERCLDLISHWEVGNTIYDVMYLSADLSLTPRANMTANSTALQWALTDWLGNNSNQDSQVYIWIFGDGVGLYHQPPQPGIEEYWSVQDPTSVEYNSDEGPEITEFLIGYGSKSNTTWVGVEEGICLSSTTGNETVWGDDLQQWLQSTNYRRMMVYISSCSSPEASDNATHCFSGGLIDDLSAPRRIIITCTNETYTSWYDPATGIGFFDAPFMDALDPGTAAWNASCGSDGVTSVLEAYLYAYQHDQARKALRTNGGTIPDPWQVVYPKWWRLADESPWLDDGGNFLPTFKNGADANASSFGYDQGDNQTAMYTWPFPPAYSGCKADVNDDGTVDGSDMIIAARTFGYGYPHPQWSSSASLADITEDNAVDGADLIIIARNFGWHRW
jgi:hypothetical protein